MLRKLRLALHRQKILETMKRKQRKRNQLLGWRGFIILSVLVVSSAFQLGTQPPDVFKAGEWEQEQLAAMDMREKIAQLLMIEVRPTLGQGHLDHVQQTVETYQVGGLIFFKGEPLHQLQFTNELQGKSKVPMLIAIDGEWGLSMRLSQTTEFPYQLALGAIEDENLIYQMGREIGRQCRRMGIHVNFAPVADINNNPNNPVINFRSFGENKENVARKAWMYAKGMQEESIIACAKHFPGHGDTETDSHKDLPLISHNRYHLDSFELYPFRYMFEKGVRSIMSAHLYIPALDDTPEQATSISPKAINELLRKEMGFKGLVFTDALNMKGVSKFHESGELELKALLAGNDILLGPEDVPAAIDRIEKAIIDEEWSMDELDRKVLKVLAAKRYCGLQRYAPKAESALISDLNTNKAKQLKSKLIRESLVLLKDEKKQLPLKTEKQKTAFLAIGSSQPETFQKTARLYINADFIQCSSNPSIEEQIQLIDRMKGYERVVISLHGLSKYASRGYGIYSGMKQLVASISNSNNTVLVLFGNPYALESFPDPSAVLLAYDDDELYQKNAALALCGQNSISGKLTVSSGIYKAGQGLKTEKKTKLGLGNSDFDKSEWLNTSGIDSILERAIEIQACPGAQVLIARNGEVEYYQSYGHHTYDRSSNTVRIDDLYDLASITKIAATTLAVMKLYEDGRIKLSDPLSRHLPYLKNTNKEHITFEQVLSHTAGLQAWIPFYLRTRKNEESYEFYYASVQKLSYPTEAGPSLFINKTLPDSIIRWVIASPVKNPGNYVYSDLGMILLKETVERITQCAFSQYLDEQFYLPMGLSTLGFNPRMCFNEERIVPTEYARDFRTDLIHGYVHDPAAAMLGGVSGHAGLFSNAFDLAAIMQMLLDGGKYNGKQMLKKETIDQFSEKYQKSSRRGLGFDKPETDRSLPNPASDLAPASCFGHTGFTGTMVWADPENELIYVFLSNRIHPNADNKKLITENIRTAVMDVIYQSMASEKEKLDSEH